MSEKEENIVYLGETIFKAHCVRIKSWSRKYENQVLNKEGLCVDTLAAAVIISGKFGLEQFIIK